MLIKIIGFPRYDLIFFKFNQVHGAHEISVNHSNNKVSRATGKIGSHLF